MTSSIQVAGNSNGAYAGISSQAGSALSGVYYNFSVPLGLRNLIMQVISNSQGSLNTPQIQTPSSNRVWFSQPRLKNDTTVEVLSINFTVPVSISSVGWDVLQTDCTMELWYVDELNNTRPVLSSSMTPVTLNISSSSTSNWYTVESDTYPFTAQSLQFRFKRNPASTTTTPYVVGMRNGLIRHNIYTRQDGVAAIQPTQDEMGNTITSSVKDYPASNAVDNNATSFWQSYPQASANAVCCLYLDVRDPDGNAQLIDTVYIDPLYNGQNLNFYYSNDDTTGVLSLSPVSLLPTNNINTDWALGTGLWDTSAITTQSSLYQFPFAWGPIVKQPAWLGIEWAPNFSSVVTNTVQLVNIDGNPTGGTWNLTTVPGTTNPANITADLPYNATAEQVQAALNVLYGGSTTAGLVTVTGKGGTSSGAAPYVVTFVGSLAGTSVATMGAVNSLIGGSYPPTVTPGNSSPATSRITVATTVTGGLGETSTETCYLFEAQAAGVNGVDAVQVITLEGVVPGGTAAGSFTLTYDGYTTPALSYNASALTVQTALRALPSINGSNVLVQTSTTASGQWIVNFNNGTEGGGRLAAQPVPDIKANSYVTGGVSNASQILTVSGAPTGGSLKLEIPTGSTSLEATIPWPSASGASAASIQSAIQNSIPASTTPWWETDEGASDPTGTPVSVSVEGPVTSGSSLVYVITFGGSEGNSAPLLTPVTTSLTGGSSPTASMAYAAQVMVATTTAGQLPITPTNSTESYPTVSVVNGAIQLQFTNSAQTYTCNLAVPQDAPSTMTSPLSAGNAANIVVAWDYDANDGKGEVFIEVMSQGFVVGTYVNKNPQLPDTVCLDGTISFKTFQGTLTAHIFKLEGYANNYQAFQANPQVYVTPPPTTPANNGVVAATTLDNAIYGSCWTKQQFGTGGDDRSKYAQKLWTPIYADYTTAKGNVYLPKQYMMKYLCLEFYNLTPEPYVIYDTNIQTTYQTFPFSVTQQTTQPLGQIGELAGLLTLGADIILSGIGSVNWLNPQTVNNAVNSVFGQVAGPVTVTTGQVTSSTYPALPNSANGSTSLDTRSEVSSPWVYKRSPVSTTVLAANVIQNTVHASNSSVTGGQQGIKAALPPGMLDLGNGVTWTPKTNPGFSSSAVPVQGDDWWVFPGGTLKMPTPTMQALTGSTEVDLGPGLSTTTTYRFNGTQTHTYQNVTVTQDASIAYYTGVREVQPYVTTYIDSQDPVSFDFNRYDPTQWSFYNVEQLTGTDGTYLGPITTAGSLYEIQNPQFDPSQQQLVGKDGLVIDAGNIATGQTSSYNNVVSGWIQAQGRWSWSGNLVIDGTPTGGSYQLVLSNTINSNQTFLTGFIDYDADAGDIQRELYKLAALQNADVTVSNGEAPGTFIIQLANIVSNQPYAVVGATSWLLGVGASVEVYNWKCSGQLSIPSAATGGFINLVLTNSVSGDTYATTPEIGAPATIAEILSAIEQVVPEDTQVSVTGSSGTFNISLSGIIGPSLALGTPTSTLTPTQTPALAATVTSTSQTSPYGGGWFWDGTMGHWYLGSATVQANGEEQVLLSSAVDVTPGATVSLSAWATWQGLGMESGVPSPSIGSSPIQVQAWFYGPNEVATPTNPVDVNLGDTGITPVIYGIDPTQWPVGTSQSSWVADCPTINGNTWQQITKNTVGTPNTEFTVPTGAVQMRVALVVTNKVASGQVWFDTVEVLGQSLVEGRASRVFNTFSDFVKLTCTFDDSGSVKSDSMWSTPDVADTNVPSTALAYYTSLFPDIIPSGMWSDALSTWDSSSIVWGEPEAVVNVSVSQNMVYQGRRALLFQRAAGAGAAGIQVTQSTNFVPNALARLGCVFYKPQTGVGGVYTVPNTSPLPTIIQLAANLSTTQAALLKYNPDLSNGIYAGMVLTIPPLTASQTIPDQIQLELVQVSTGTVVYSELFTPPEGFWYEHVTQFFEVPDSPDQVYNLTLTLNGSLPDSLYVNDLYTEIANIRYFVQMGGQQAYMHDVTPLAFNGGKAVVGCTTPVNEFIVDTVILSPNSYAYGCSLQPQYLR